MRLPRTSAFVGVSLDGFLDRLDGSVDWLKPFEAEEHGFSAFFRSVDTVVMGRKTYEFVASMLGAGHPWMYAGKRCLVMTHQPLRGQHGERAHAGEPGPLVQQLAAEGARHLYVDGGVVIRSFIAAGLLDELTVTVVPVLLGEGLPLFGGVRLESPLELEHVASFSKGMVQLRYQLRQSHQSRRD